jgi:uncharacterized protein YdeI (YjbR/CyaY-like superfamily)
MPNDVRFFATPSDFRKWLKIHHEKTTQLWVGFYRKASERPSITWPESVDEALCVGWIDGLRKTIDATSYKIRFTPRRANSSWSVINIARVQELTRLKRMCPAGIKAFEQRREAKSGIYSYENRKSTVLDGASEKKFRAHRKGWAFFKTLPQSYRQNVIWWVISAKQEETRKRRLEKLIAACEEKRRLY